MKLDFDENKCYIINGLQKSPYPVVEVDYCVMYLARVMKALTGTLAVYGYNISHLCHEMRCINPCHIMFELPVDNICRLGCQRSIEKGVSKNAEKSFGCLEGCIHLPCIITYKIVPSTLLQQKILGISAKNTW